MSLRSNFLMRPVNRTARLFQQTLVGVSRKFQQNLRLSHSTRDESELQLWNYTSSVVFVLFGLALFCSLFVFNLRQVFYSSCSFNHFCSKILLQIHKWVKQKTLENIKTLLWSFYFWLGHLEISVAFPVCRFPCLDGEIGCMRTQCFSEAVYNFR